MKGACSLSDREQKIWRLFAGRFFSRPSLKARGVPLLGAVVGAGRQLALTSAGRPLSEKKATVHRRVTGVKGKK
jgi:hypothetical protein